MGATAFGGIDGRNVGEVDVGSIEVGDDKIGACVGDSVVRCV